MSIVLSKKVPFQLQFTRDIRMTKASPRKRAHRTRNKKNLEAKTMAKLQKSRMYGFILQRRSFWTSMTSCSSCVKSLRKRAWLSRKRQQTVSLSRRLVSHQSTMEREWIQSLWRSLTNWTHHWKTFYTLPKSLRWMLKTLLTSWTKTLALKLKVNSSIYEQ